MSIQKIGEGEYYDRCIARLPTRPNALSAYTGAALSAEGLKDAFDAMSLLIKQRYNDLVAAILDGSVSEVLPVGEGLSLSACLSSLSTASADHDGQLGDLRSTIGTKHDPSNSDGTLYARIKSNMTQLYQLYTQLNGLYQALGNPTVPNSDTVFKRLEDADAAIVRAMEQIAEARLLAEGAMRARVFATVKEMIDALNGAAEADFRIGDRLFILETAAPDFWISGVYTDTITGSAPDTFSDATAYRFGHFDVSVAETAIDLRGYATVEELKTAGWVEKHKDEDRYYAGAIPGVEYLIIYSEEWHDSPMFGYYDESTGSDDHFGGFAFDEGYGGYVGVCPEGANEILVGGVASVYSRVTDAFAELALSNLSGIEATVRQINEGGIA